MGGRVGGTVGGAGGTGISVGGGKAAGGVGVPGAGSGAGVAAAGVGVALAGGAGGVVPPAPAVVTGATGRDAPDDPPPVIPRSCASVMRVGVGVAPVPPPGTAGDAVRLVAGDGLRVAVALRGVSVGVGGAGAAWDLPMPR
ncbi:MAG: hypothetical protein HYX53_00480 [Chloroflexi bacterium]|nr:hypothetical protein [Chloroflexota bacterium]